MLVRLAKYSTGQSLRSSRTNVSKMVVRNISRNKKLQSTNKLKSVSLFVGGIIAGSAALYTWNSYNQFNDNDDTNQCSIKHISSSTNPLYASVKDTIIALEKIEKIVGVQNVRKDKDLLDEHSDSSWQTRHRKPNEVPVAVVFPSSTEQVSGIMRIANEYKVPVTAFCGGTSLEGQFTPVYGGISLDMSKMCNIKELYKDDMNIVVEPAVQWEELNEALKPHGLMFGTDAGPGATIAGMVNTGASGINAYFYGPMRHNVVNLTVVLADGTIIKTKRRPKKSSAGYNLNELFIGSEGTLGIVTGITLKLFPLPSHIRVGLLTFHNIADATRTVQEMLKLSISPNAIELLDDEQMKIINASGATDRKWDEEHTLLLRFAGATQDSIDSSINRVKEISKKHGLIKFDFANNEDESSELWSARKNALWSVSGAFPEKKMWTTDVAVPMSHLSQIITDSKDYVKQAGIKSAVVGHVGDGNFHLLLAYDPINEKAAVEEVAERLVKRAIELDGTCTGEHGVGAGKRRYLLEEVGSDTVALMRNIKASLDPNTILNPGKIFQTSISDISDHV